MESVDGGTDDRVDTREPKSVTEADAHRPKSPDTSLKNEASNAAMFVTPERKLIPASGAEFLDRLRQAAASYKKTPSIFQHTTQEEEDELEKKLEYRIPLWDHVYQGKPGGAHRNLKYALRPSFHTDALSRKGVQKVSRGTKSKGLSSGRTFTSRYRGVHQTFPTKRWEAQFRRNGKPTSLGCFDEEAEAARAYDKMMIWCELNSHSPQKGGYGITNFDMSQYEKEIPYLSSITQDALTQALRQDGRNQAAKRAMRQKRDGQLGVTQLTAAIEHAREDMDEDASNSAKQSNSQEDESS